jgi:hypothetical protein
MTMKPDFDHIKKLWGTFDDSLDAGESLAALNQLRSLLPPPLFKKLNDGDPTVEEFERAFHRYYKQESPDEADDDGTDDDLTDIDANDSLLPFPGFENYVLDDWGRPHGVGVQGQRVGPLTAIKQWKPAGKGGTARFIFGYRLYREGKRVYQSALQCAIARLNAETAPQKAQYLADKGRSRHTKR